MVVCLKHVGITVKTLASWSVDALSNRPGSPSGPAALYVNLFKGYISATESVITQSSGTAGALMHVSVLSSSKRAWK